MVGVEIRMISTGQFIQGFVGRGKKFEFYFTCNQKPLKGSFPLDMKLFVQKIILTLEQRRKAGELRVEEVRLL